MYVKHRRQQYRRRIPSLVILLVLLLFTALGRSGAQVEKGVITGLIKDNSGAVIPGARISLRNIATGVITSTAADGEGLFVSPPLAPGDYDVKIEAAGFNGIQKRVRLEVAQRIRADANLNVGSNAETVEVDAKAIQFDTDTSTVSNLRTEEAVHNLPLNGRNFAELLGLGAGVVPGQSQLAGSIPYAQQRGPSSYAINGQRMTDNRFLLDGIGNNENHNGLGVVIFPPIDAVSEFREETNDADARFGRASGGIINLIYKSGGSHYHGTVFNFFRNAALDAKNYFDKQKPGFHMNSFGATFGGPIFPGENPKTFFFADYAGQRTSQGLTYVNTVPAWGAEGVGDFSLYAVKVHDPVTKVNFPGNIVPASYLATPQLQVGQNVLALYSQYDVTPNISGTTTANNFRYAPQRIDNSNAFDVKVDYTFSDKDNAFIRYSHSYDDILQPGLLPTPLVGANICGPAQQPAHQAVLSETHLFSPSLLNTARFGWSRIFIAAQNFDQGLNLPTQLGIPGVVVPGDERNTDGLPAFSITGLTSIGDPVNSPAQIGTNNYEETDNLTWVHGKHSFDFGADIVRLQYNMFQTASEHGSLSFTGNFTGLGVADLLLGAPTSGTRQYQQGTRGFRQLDLAFYAQDSYKVTSRLTLNLGLRYDNFLGWPWTEVQDRMYQFDPSLSTTQVFRVGSNGVSRSGAKGNNVNLEPRVGFAFRLANRTTFHAGYGLYYAAPNVVNSSGLSMNAPALDYSAFNNTSYSSPTFHWLSDGFTHIPATTNAPQGAPLFSVDLNAKTPYSAQWHASIQQQIGSENRLTIAYVGNSGFHLDSLVNINQAMPGTTVLATRRPYPYFAQIAQLQTAQNSSYNGLQITGERRSKQLTFLVSYTYSHALDQNSNNPGTTMNSYQPRWDYGNSDQNIPNRFVGSVNYSLPFKGSGLLRPVIAGWQVNGIVTFSDGIPFTVVSGTNQLGIADGVTPRAMLLSGHGDGSLSSGKRKLSQWFDTTAFVNVGTNWDVPVSTAPGPATLARRNSLQGPGTKDIDFSAFKSFNLTESKKLELRSEFFNLFNTPQFNNPSATVGTSTFGTVASAGSPTTLQRTSREIQLAAKFSF